MEVLCSNTLQPGFLGLELNRQPLGNIALTTELWLPNGKYITISLAKIFKRSVTKKYFEIYGLKRSRVCCRSKHTHTNYIPQLGHVREECTMVLGRFCVEQLVMDLSR